MAKPGHAANLWMGCCLLALFLAALLAPAHADWLATRDGRAVETRGAGSAAVASSADEPGPIVLYTTTWCGYCRKTRELLTALGEPFEDKDIEKSAAAREEYEAKGRGYSGVPLIDFDGTVIHGFDEKRLRRLVAERQKEAEAEAPPAE